MLVHAIRHILSDRSIKCLRSIRKERYSIPKRIPSWNIYYAWNQIGRWTIKIGQVDILLEVFLFSSHLSLPSQGHLEQVMHIFGYLKVHTKLRLIFDSSKPQIISSRFKTYDWFDFYRGSMEGILSDIPEAWGFYVSISVFVDTDLVGDKLNRNNQTDILIFVNKLPLYWYIKHQP